MKFKLIEIKINNFFGFKEAKFLDLKNYNVLIGKNNAGKSNLFRILKLLKNISTNDVEIEKEALYDRDESLVAKINLTFYLSERFRNDLLNKKNVSKHLELVTKRSNDYPNSWNKDTIEWIIEKGYFSKIKFSLEYSKKNSSLFIKKITVLNHKTNTKSVLMDCKIEDSNPRFFYLIGKKFLEELTNLSEYLSVKRSSKKFKYSYHGSNLLANFGIIIDRLENDNSDTYHPLLAELLKDFKEFIFERNFIHYIPDIRQYNIKKEIVDLDRIKPTPNGSNLSRFHLMKKTNDTEWLERFNLELQEFFPKNVEFSVRVENNQAITYLKEKGLSSFFKLNNIGRGIINIALILTYLSYYKDGYLIMIEEPESFIFPGLQKKLRDKLIKISTNNQFFISTHSPNYLKRDFENSSVYYIKKDNAISKVKLLSQKDTITIFKDLDLSFYDYILYDGIMFVEGPKDEEVFNIFIKQLFDKNFKIISIGGKNNLIHYASTKIIQFLDNSSFRYIFILDKDRGNDDFYKRINNQDLRVLVKKRSILLNLYEIENFFIQPILILDYLYTSSIISDVKSHNEWIIELINNTFETLGEINKEYILKRLNDKIYPSLRRVDINDILTKFQKIDNLNLLFKEWYNEFSIKYNEKLEWFENSILDKEKFITKLKNIQNDYETQFQNQNYNKIISGKKVFKIIRSEIVKK
ncbi:MAG: AAA family ATPase, partial [Candidatus Lokiarchaeota archaeon]|nr:AAA family ATPase [Candidatus Lokiarchaeota archaeon]